MTSFFSILAVAVLAGVGVLADYFLKLAGNGVKYIEYRPFLIGMVLYASTAFGWFYIMKHMKLGTLGLFYSITTLILLVIVGVFVFDEKVSTYEIIGIVLGITSIIILARFG